MTKSSLSPGTVVRTEIIPGARHWSIELRRGFALRLTDQEGGGNCAVLLYNASNPLERFNMPDTLKAQHTAFLTRGHCCYSDMGRILVSIMDDTCGWHDVLCGVSDAALVLEKYGEARYQERRNAWHRNGRESLLIELGKWGMTASDLVDSINFFSKVAIASDGSLHFVQPHSRPGAQVALRAEMDTLVVLDTCPHPLDPSPTWGPKPIGCEIVFVGPPADDDVCRLSRPENGRGYANTARYLAQRDFRCCE